MKHGAKVTLICQTAKIGVGCLLKIEAYEYTDAPGIKHLFFYFAEDSKRAIPYFMLDSEVWEKIKLSIMKDI